MSSPEMEKVSLPLGINGCCLTTGSGLSPLDTLFTAYFVPFNGILDIDGCSLSLVNDLSFYSTEIGRVPENVNDTTLTFSYLKSPVIFSKLVVAMKERSRTGSDNSSVDAATALEMVAMNTAADEETRSVLLDIQAQLKRQNELLEESMPKGSIV